MITILTEGYDSVAQTYGALMKARNERVEIVDITRNKSDIVDRYNISSFPIAIGNHDEKITRAEMYEYCRKISEQMRRR